MQTVVNSASYGAGYGVNGKPKKWKSSYENEDLTEVKHSMHGPAWVRKNGGIDEIADMREKLANGVVEFTFWKHSDEGDIQRHAIGTTSEQIIPTSERRRLDPNYDENVVSYERRSGFIIWFWDLEKNAVRCFNTNRFDEIINYTPTTQRITPNVERIGNIFIHRDVDSNMENNQPLTDERIDQINDELENLVANNDIEIGIDHQANDIRQVYVDRTPQNEPVLRIEISKRGTDNDRPYELRINELRQAIRERYGVIIKKVTVDGIFQY
jgi:hypothetical protein